MERKLKRFKNYITWKDKKGNFNTECNRASLDNGIALTIPTTDLTKVAEMNGGGLSMPRIRKLTPLECLKLQGFNEEHFNSVKNDFSSSAIYHVAGDSITTTTLVSIFGEMTDLPYREIIQKYVETLKGDYEDGNKT